MTNYKNYEKKLEELKTELKNMTEIERSKFMAQMYQGLAATYEHDKATGWYGLRPENHILGEQYFWTRIDLCSKASAEHMFTKEELESLTKKHSEEVEKAREKKRKSDLWDRK